MDCTTARPSDPWIAWSRPRPDSQGVGIAVLATRKPVLLFRLSGVFLLRLADRVLFGLLFQEPPRSTREAGRRPQEQCTLKQIGTQPPRIRVGRMGDPRPHPLCKVFRREHSGPVQSLIHPQAPTKPHHAPPVQHAVVGPEPVSQEPQSILDAAGQCLEPVRQPLSFLSVSPAVTHASSTFMVRVPFLLARKTLRLRQCHSHQDRYGTIIIASSCFALTNNR